MVVQNALQTPNVQNVWMDFTWKQSMQLNQHVNTVHRRFQGVNTATLPLFVQSALHSIILIPHWLLEVFYVPNVPHQCQDVNFVSMPVNVSSAKVGIFWTGQVNYAVCVLWNCRAVFIVQLMEIHANFVTLVITYHWQQTNVSCVHLYRQAVKCVMKLHPVSLHVSRQGLAFISNLSVLSNNLQSVMLFTVTYVCNPTLLNASHVTQLFILTHQVRNVLVANKKCKLVWLVRIRIPALPVNLDTFLILTISVQLVHQNLTIAFCVLNFNVKNVKVCTFWILKL